MRKMTEQKQSTETDKPEESQSNVVEKNKKSREEKIRDSLELFDEDKDYDFESETEIQIKVPDEATNNMLKISRIVKVSVLALEGYQQKPNQEMEKVTQFTYKLVRQPLASHAVIKAFQGILETYADEANLISKMEWEQFAIRARADWGSFYKTCMRDKAQPDDTLRTVERIFQGCIIAIGEITTGNSQNMSKLFGTLGEGKKMEDNNNIFNEERSSRR